MRIQIDTKYPELYRVVWPNGDISVNSKNPEYAVGHFGFYNKSRAKEFLKREGIENYERGVTYNHPLGRD